MCFLKSAELASLEESEPISTLIQVSCRRWSFQKLTQLSQGNNVLDSPASNTEGFLQETHVILKQVNRTIWNKMGLSAP
jgi:hypothetical protein